MSIIFKICALLLVIDAFFGARLLVHNDYIGASSNFKSHCRRRANLWFTDIFLSVICAFFATFAFSLGEANSSLFGIQQISRLIKAIGIF
jgi:hypothetical protein